LDPNADDINSASKGSLLARLRGAGEKSPFFPPFFKMKQFAAQRNKICVT
jgi:hypothetical protein